MNSAITNSSNAKPSGSFILLFHGHLYNSVTQLFHLNGLTNGFGGAAAKFSGVL